MKNNESGYVLIITTLIMFLLTAIGVSSISTTSFSLNVTKNERAYKDAFYAADAGIYSIPKVISLTIDQSQAPDATDIPNITFVGVDGRQKFENEVLGIRQNSGATHIAGPDLNISLESMQSSIDVQYLGIGTYSGGAMEFASGAGGLGQSAAGSMAVMCSLTSEGKGPNSSKVVLDCIYRKMIGVPGGL